MMSITGLDFGDLKHADPAETPVASKAVQTLPTQTSEYPLSTKFAEHPSLLKK